MRGNFTPRRRNCYLHFIENNAKSVHGDSFVHCVVQLECTLYVYLDIAIVAARLCPPPTLCKCDASASVIIVAVTYAIMARLDIFPI